MWKCKDCNDEIYGEVLFSLDRDGNPTNDFMTVYTCPFCFGQNSHEILTEIAYWRED